MIIETCRAEAEWIQRHGWLNNSRPCFLGLCCLYGAAAHLDELCQDALSTEDMWALRNSLLAFSTRWKLGGMIFFSTRDVHAIKMNILIG
jgi:hypothetical protein